MTVTSAPVVGVGDLVRVKNLGNPDNILADGSHGRYYGDITLTWNSRDYRCPVGQEVIVPFEAVKVALGDPRAVESIASQRDAFGIVSWIPDRASEIRRLRAVYDNQTGTEDEVLPGSHPLVEVYDLEGNRIPTVLDDPTGESVIESRPTVADSNDLIEMVRRQQRTIDMLVEKQGITQDDLPNDSASVESDYRAGSSDVPNDSTPQTKTQLGDDDLPSDE